MYTHRWTEILTRKNSE